MAFGFNTDKSKNENVVSLPDFSYASRDPSYDFSITSLAGDSGLYKSYDITKKGWYRIAFGCYTPDASDICYLSAGDTSHTYNASNWSTYFYTLHESDTVSNDGLMTLIIPLDVGDRIGIKKPTTGSRCGVVAKYIPFKE